MSEGAGKGDKYRPVNQEVYNKNFDKIDWSQWYVYLVECSDGSYYCGISNDLDNRINTHNSGKGAKYTSSRRPVKLVFSEKCKNKSEALKRECEIKKMKKQEKKCLINGYNLKGCSNTEVATG